MCLLNDIGMNDTPDIERVIGKIHNPDPSSTLTAPFDYLQSLPSNNNRIRSKFLTGFNERFFHIANGKLIAEIGAIIETFHGASLLIDDIEDASTFRRGKPCAHIKFGMPATLNSGNMMYFVAIQRAFSTLPAFYLQEGLAQPDSVLFKSRLSDIYMEEMINLHRGQGYDIYWRDNLPDVLDMGLPSIEEYLEVVMHKTGGLFRLAVRTLDLFASTTSKKPLQSSTQDLIKLANLLGIIYQIRDDYLNLVDERYAEMKGVASEDLIEGKLSLPILYALLQQDGSSVLHQLYTETSSPNERRADLVRLEKVRSFIADSGALHCSYSLLQQYIEKAKALVGNEIDGSSKTLLELLDKLSQVSIPSGEE